MAKDPFLHENYYFFDGSIKKGTYRIKGIVKWLEVYWRDNTPKRCVGTKLSKTYWLKPNQEKKIVLKPSPSTISFNIVFCSEIPIEENIQFITEYLKTQSKKEKCRFLTLHAQPLSFILKDKFEEFYLDIIFNMGKTPESFDIWYEGKRVVDINSVKQDYKDNPKEFSLASYQKLD